MSHAAVAALFEIGGPITQPRATYLKFNFEPALISL
jgi:hypothetical protein